MSLYDDLDDAEGGQESNVGECDILYRVNI